MPTLRLPDLLRKDLDVVFCGINPALRSAQAGHHFLSGRTILDYGCGLTAAVERPTAKASELSSREFHEAAGGLERKVRRYCPRHLAFLGKPAFAGIFQQRCVEWGRQGVAFGGAKVWVLPNPSGLNRAFSLDELISAYRDLRIASRRTQLESR
jgi:TDG/mug DNA glycosylase family protein